MTSSHGWSSMGRREVNVAARQMVVAYLLLGLSCVALSRDTAAQTESKPAFSEADATRLLGQIVDGLASHNPRRMLSAFELATMNNGELFRQNTNSFFRQTGTIRAHYNILQTSMDGARGIADVRMEIEADQLNDNLPPVRKQEQLHLSFLRSDAGWRIVDLEPRTFFTTQP